MAPINVLMSKADSEVITKQFRFLATKVQDPRERREAALKHLAEAYYQQAASFTDQLSTVFQLSSPLSKKMLDVSELVLRFTQANQQYDIPCATRLCDQTEDIYQFTYWHN